MSPIRDSERARYPKNWREISKAVRQRNNGCCEWCDAPNGAAVWRCPDGSWSDFEKDPPPDVEPIRLVTVVLTVAHLDHTPENCDPSNLRSLCQTCHNRYDAPHRAAGRRARAAANVLPLGFAVLTVTL